MKVDLIDSYLIHLHTVKKIKALVNHYSRVSGSWYTRMVVWWHEVIVGGSKRVLLIIHHQFIMKIVFVVFFALIRVSCCSLLTEKNRTTLLLVACTAHRSIWEKTLWFVVTIHWLSILNMN